MVFAQNVSILMEKIMGAVISVYSHLKTRLNVNFCGVSACNMIN